MTAAPTDVHGRLIDIQSRSVHFMDNILTFVAILIFLSSFFLSFMLKLNDTVLMRVGLKSLHCQGKRRKT